MKYYSIINTTNPEVIGHYPQTERDEYYFDRLSKTYSDQLRIDNFLNFESYFKRFLFDETRLTDILDQGSVSWGMIVNQKFIDCIDKLNIPPHRYYPIEVVSKQNEFKYYWFHFYENMFAYLDLEKSLFEVISNIDFKVIETLPIQSEDAFRNKQNSLTFERSIRLKELVMKDSWPKFDIWQNNIYGLNTIISENALGALEENKISGYKVKPYLIVR